MSDIVVIGGVFRESFLNARGDLETSRIGGSGYVAALTAAAFGHDVALMSFVGEREESEARRVLERRGVDTSGLLTLPGSSGNFVISDVGDRLPPRPPYRPAENVPSPQQARKRKHPTAPLVLAFGVPGFDPLPWAEGALDPGGTFLWDRQGWFSRDVDPLRINEVHAVRRISVANVAETKRAANRSTVADALGDQPPAGFNGSGCAALIKCGRWGTVVVPADPHEDEGQIPASTFVPAYVTLTTSTIGSGDAFAGALAASLADGAELVEAAHVGAAAASLFVERVSNVLPSPLAPAIMSVRADRPAVAVNPAALERCKIYLAGPWFTVAESMLVFELESALGTLGVDLVSPRRDIGELPPRASRKQARELGERDYAAVEGCDLVCALLDHDDAGTLMEVGYAVKLRKPIIALCSSEVGRLQPVREAAGIKVTKSIEVLLEEVTKSLRQMYGLRAG